MVPATVRFIGDENKFILPSEACTCVDWRLQYCHNCSHYEDCKMMDTRSKQFTYGKLYQARGVEYWEGVRNGLVVETNMDEGYESFIPFEDFEIVSDPDNVLNNYEAEVRCINPDYDEEFEIKYGSVYKAIGMDRDGYYLVMDGTYCCYFYPGKDFEIVSDPDGVLGRESLCDYSYNECSEKPDFVYAHRYSSNHKPELIHDSICGCFYCLKIYEPKEIEEWMFDDNQADIRGTAICPYCGIDSVIGESSGYPITHEFLQKMRNYWFDL